MVKSGWNNQKLALSIAPLIALGACGTEEAGPGDEPTEVEVRAVTATDPTRVWHSVTGFLMDIATANGPPSRWGIDTNSGPGGFRVVKWSGSQWAATNGRGIRIALKGTADANNDGISDAFVPWVVKSDGRIERATDTSGSTWVQVPDILPGVLPGVTAVDIGSGPGAPTTTIWVAGSDGRVYKYDDELQRWWWDGGPSNVIRISGPIMRVEESDYHSVFALTSLGEVWAKSYTGGWLKPVTDADNLRTDVAGLINILWPSGGGFLNSIMVTSSRANNQVTTYKPDPAGVKPGVFVGTGPYSSFGFPIRTHPIAVSADRDHYRVWIVTADHRVYYGE